MSGKSKLQRVIELDYGKEIGSRFYRTITSPVNIAKLKKTYRNGDESKLDNSIRRLLHDEKIMDKCGVKWYMRVICYGAAVDLFHNKITGKKDVRRFYMDIIDEQLKEVS